MQNKLLKVALISILGAAASYTYKSWKQYRDRSEFELKDIELGQAPVDLKTVKSKFSKEIWSIKSESKIVCFNIIFKNEGSKSFYKSPFILDLLTMSLWDGAGKRDGIELKKILEDNSLSLSFEQNDDNFVVLGSCLEKHFDLITDLICDIMTKVHFKEEKIKKNKENLVVSIKQMMFSPYNLAQEKLDDLIMPEPYKYSLKDGLAIIPKYSKADLEAAYKKLFDPRNASITIVSHMDNEKIIEGFNKIFDAIEGKKSNDFKDGDHRYEIGNRGVVEHVELDNPQTSVLFALPGIEKRSKDRFALLLANDIFGAFGLVSRLSNVIRDKYGYVYRINASYINKDMQSYLRGMADTRPENVQDVIKYVKEECQKIYDKGITKDELDRFKLKIFGGNVFSSNSAILGFVESIRQDGIAASEVNGYLSNFYKLTVEEVNDVIKKVFNPEKIVFVYCGRPCESKEAKDAE